MLDEGSQNTETRLSLAALVGSGLAPASWHYSATGTGCGQAGTMGISLDSGGGRPQQRKELGLWAGLEKREGKGSAAWGPVVQCLGPFPSCWVQLAAFTTPW